MSWAAAAAAAAQMAADASKTPSGGMIPGNTISGFNFSAGSDVPPLPTVGTYPGERPASGALTTQPVGAARLTDSGTGAPVQTVQDGRVAMAEAGALGGAGPGGIPMWAYLGAAGVVGLAVLVRVT